MCISSVFTPFSYGPSLTGLSLTGLSLLIYSYQNVKSIKPALWAEVKWWTLTFCSEYILVRRSVFVEVSFRAYDYFGLHTGRISDSVTELQLLLKVHPRTGHEDPERE